MPRIKAFCGIHPVPELAGRVIAAAPDLPLDNDAVERLAKNPCSFLHLVAPPLDNRFLQGERDTLVYRKAAENLQTFLDKGYLRKDPVPRLYLYTVENGTVSRQTGVWAVTLFDDYLNNKIRKHEYTRTERENGIADYLRQTGIDANPVLIAYPSQPEIEEVIARCVKRPPVFSFEKGGKRHLLHEVRTARDIRLLIRSFDRLSAAYLADGHHRAAALSSYGVERRKFDFKHTGQEEYNYFSSLYFTTDSLEIKPFHRLVADLNSLTPGGFLDVLSRNFRVTPASAPPVLERGSFGMYLTGNWYLLAPAGNTVAGRGISNDAGAGRSINNGAVCERKTDGGPEEDPVARLDVTRLQEDILAPLLGIHNPRTDPRLRFSGGTVSPETLAAEVDAGKAAVLFTLFRTSIDQLTDVADAGLVMPPKSTWFEPKLDLGILTHFID